MRIQTGTWYRQDGGLGRCPMLSPHGFLVAECVWQILFGSAP